MVASGGARGGRLFFFCSRAATWLDCHASSPTLKSCALRLRSMAAAAAVALLAMSLAVFGLPRLAAGATRSLLASRSAAGVWPSVLAPGSAAGASCSTLAPSSDAGVALASTEALVGSALSRAVTGISGPPPDRSPSLRSAISRRMRARSSSRACRCAARRLAPASDGDGDAFGCGGVCLDRKRGGHSRGTGSSARHALDGRWCGASRWRGAVRARLPLALRTILKKYAECTSANKARPPV